MKQERQFNGRFTEEAANCIMQLINNGHIKGMRNADDKLMCQGEEFSNFASLVDFELFTKLYSMRYMKG